MPEVALAYLDELRPAFVAHLAARLDNQICAETASLAVDAGIKAPVQSHSALLFLFRRGPATMAEIARVDGQSHQLLASRFKSLEASKLIERVEDADDRRRRPYRLTQAGREDARRVEALISDLAEAMQGVFAAVGVDLCSVLTQTIVYLQRHPLAGQIPAAQASTKSGSDS